MFIEKISTGACLETRDDREGKVKLGATAPAFTSIYVAIDTASGRIERITFAPKPTCFAQVDSSSQFYFSRAKLVSVRARGVISGVD